MIRYGYCGLRTKTYHIAPLVKMVTNYDLSLHCNYSERVVKLRYSKESHLTADKRRDESYLKRGAKEKKNKKRHLPIKTTG